MLRVFGSILLFMACSGAAVAAEKDQVPPWWWDEAWWSEGTLEQPKNYPVETRWLTYQNGDTEVRALLARPKGGGKYPGVLFAHGRRGLDELTQPSAIRLAARGFVVFAPDLYAGRFIEPFPIEHDYRVEDDLDKGVDAFLALPDLKGKKVCALGISRGGYYALKLATTKGRQQKDLACYVAYYPHMQDPNAPEPAQVYQYAAEVDQLTIPVLIFMGEQEQYQRKRGIESAVNSLKLNNKPVRLVEYPGVGRGFDFRGGNVRTFADDLAAKDAVRRAAEFINAALR